MHHSLKIALGILFVIGLFVAAYIASGYIQANDQMQNIIQSFGVFGIFIVSIIGGLNLIVPVPPTALIPVFEAAGFTLPIIIIVMVLGMTVADFVSYYLGVFLKRQTEPDFRMYTIVKKWCSGKPHTTQVIVFLYAALIPLPNELLLLPLGALGFRLLYLVPAFILGSILHVSLIAFGFNLIG